MKFLLSYVLIYLKYKYTLGLQCLILSRVSANAVVDCTVTQTNSYSISNKTNIQNKSMINYVYS